MPFDSLKNQNNFFSVLVADLIAKGGINTTGYSGNLAELILNELDNLVQDPDVARDLDLRTEDIKREYGTNLHPILLSLARTKEILIDTRARIIDESGFVKANFQATLCSASTRVESALFALLQTAINESVSCPKTSKGAIIK